MIEEIPCKASEIKKWVQTGGVYWSRPYENNDWRRQYYDTKKQALVIERLEHANVPEYVKQWEWHESRT